MTAKARHFLKGRNLYFDKLKCQNCRVDDFGMKREALPSRHTLIRPLDKVNLLFDHLQPSTAGTQVRPRKHLPSQNIRVAAKCLREIAHIDRKVMNALELIRLHSGPN
ncbi:MAG: hypothetical protein EA417_08565 [Gammaproteobacteria bacterium]|nr:MAG: hypothetical protein EA417_08565 [Gammaproteobacteria bacterium]